jgi:hypothetical protein
LAAWPYAAGVGRPVAYLLLATALLPLLGACAHHRAEEAVPTDWRLVASDGDRTRIRTWRNAFTKALEMARKSGNGAAIEARGALLRIDTATGDPALPPGDYHCRAVRLGAIGAGERDLVEMPVDACRVTGEGSLLRIAKLSGAQRPSGLLYPDGDYRMIFLGTMRLADERGALAYGRDNGRDMAGFVERIGPRRWRLVLPWPQWQSTLEVVEITPE